MNPETSEATREAVGVIANSGRLVAAMIVSILLMLIAIGVILWLT